jgi:uncharacterized MAPEG superfamily protein
MDLVALVIGLALLQYFLFGFAVGRARGKFNVPAPATSGHPEFERTFRVQQNTLEQLVIFVPSIWGFATFVSAPIAAGLGALFIVGRFLYSRGYTAEASKRGTGFLIGALAQVSLLLGSIIGAGIQVFR